MPLGMQDLALLSASQRDLLKQMLEALSAQSQREIPAPVVHVTTPEIALPAMPDFDLSALAAALEPTLRSASAEAAAHWDELKAQMARMVQAIERQDKNHAMRSSGGRASVTIRDAGGTAVNPASEETLQGVATENTLQEVLDALIALEEKTQDETSGTWAYYAGVDGTVNVTGRVYGITARTGAIDGTMSINGGTSVLLRRYDDLSWEPRGQLLDPTVTFTDTDQYIIEVMAP